MFGGIPSMIKKCFMTGDVCNRMTDVSEDLRTVFMIMPFKNKDTVYKAVKDGIKGTNFLLKRGDDYSKSRMLSCKICEDIQKSKFIICDLSRENANVYFELGLAFALSKNVKIIKDNTSPLPSDINGIEFLSYDEDNVDSLSNDIRQWLQIMEHEKYYSDRYLEGHELYAKHMKVEIDNYNAKGDASTLYTFHVQQISPPGDETFYALPYHDSVALDVYEEDFKLRAYNEDNQDLNIDRIIFSSKLKRFSCELPKLELGETTRFNVSLHELQLFDQDETEDWYDVNIIYPIEKLEISINTNKAWKIKRVWLTYGETRNQIRREIDYFNYDHNKIRVCLKRPKVGLTYFIRWEWEL
jgi:hypothetical protein